MTSAHEPGREALTDEERHRFDEIVSALRAEPFEAGLVAASRRHARRAFTRVPMAFGGLALLVGIVVAVGSLGGSRVVITMIAVLLDLLVLGLFFLSSWVCGQLLWAIVRGGRGRSGRRSRGGRR